MLRTHSGCSEFIRLTEYIRFDNFSFTLKRAKGGKINRKWDLKKLKTNDEQ